MKIRNNARNGKWIIIAIAMVALAMLLIVESIPNEDINTLSNRYNLGINWHINALSSTHNLSNTEGKIYTWKIVCYIIVGILIILSTTIDLVMCRCNYCGRHIHGMDVFTMYCPYCSKSLDTKK